MYSPVRSKVKWHLAEDLLAKSMSARDRADRDKSRTATTGLRRLKLDRSIRNIKRDLGLMKMPKEPEGKKDPVDKKLLALYRKSPVQYYEEEEAREAPLLVPGKELPEDFFNYSEQAGDYDEAEEIEPEEEEEDDDEEEDEPSVDADTEQEEAEA